MLQRCPSCRTERTDMTVQSEESLVVCPECGYERSFVQPPLCIITGAAGTGKTTIRRALAGEVEAVLLEDDCIWDQACDFDSETEFNEYVLRLCCDVAQSKIPVVLFTTGLGVPETVEALVNRRYFGESHYLALVCDDDIQAERLRARPGWEGSDYWADVEKQLEFNNWFKENASEEDIRLLNTTDRTVDETVIEVGDWLSKHLTSSRNTS